MTETTETTTETPEVSQTNTETSEASQKNIEQTITQGGASSDDKQEESNEPSLFDQTEKDIADENRPEWLPEKFNSPEELGKSYLELEKKLGAHTGAPEEYELEVSEGLEDYSITTEDPFAADFAKILKDNGVNQKTYNEVANHYFNKMKVDQETIDLAQDEQFKNDCKEVGDDGLKDIKSSIQWAKETLPEETYNFLAEVGNKDLVIGKMIKQFHDAYESKNFVRMPDNPSKIMSDIDMQQKAMDMMADEKYGKVQSYTKKVDDFYKTVYAD